MTRALQLATLVADVPRGHEWIHEVKFDGYRIVCELKRGKATLFSRNGKDWTAPFAHVAEAIEQLPVKSAILDGEVVSLSGGGAGSFQELQNVMGRGKGRLAYYVFDLLELDGRDLTAEPLEARKARLRQLLGKRGEAGRGVLRYTAHLDGDGRRLYREACHASLEGIVCKRRDRAYHPGRGNDWVKVKCHREQELVIGGFTDPRGGRKGFGALLLGVHDAKGALRYAGKVGTGFTDASLRELTHTLVKLETARSPFADGPRVGARGVHFVEPRLVAQVTFTEWTSDGHLRHPSFAGLRTDKPARAVVRETEHPVEEVERTVRETEPTLRVVPPHEPRAARPGLLDGPLRVAGIAISHPHRILYRDQGVTKVELAAYYERVAERILPHLAGRPLTLVRCPDGQGKPCFFQKHAGEGTLQTVNRVIVKESHRRAPYMMVDTVQGLVTLVQMGVLELHVWGSRIEDLEHPDRMVLDLDPGAGVTWARVVEAARGMKKTLESLGLEAFVKTTGGNGLHVVVPLTRGKNDWSEMKGFAQALAVKMVREEPDRFVAVAGKENRPRKIFVDYLRNTRGATSVAVYATRARPGATVSMPVPWSALSSIGPDTFNIRSALAALARRRADPWARIDRVKQHLTAAMLKKLRA